MLLHIKSTGESPTDFFEVIERLIHYIPDPEDKKAWEDAASGVYHDSLIPELLAVVAGVGSSRKDKAINSEVQPHLVLYHLKIKLESEKITSARNLPSSHTGDDVALACCQ
ncbi:unnamed protein product [Lepeophtheirus salmonis]|uniref:(salmon louse) hypothetical protein n=1 Tax=Lepeophtheirus salmonis TaxID=72036 RepID=A0A817FCK2_LEPSM|nr:unnamed protein product [Lepeophtheirus salmonis]